MPSTQWRPCAFITRRRFFAAARFRPRSDGGAVEMRRSLEWRPPLSRGALADRNGKFFHLSAANQPQAHRSAHRLGGEARLDVVVATHRGTVDGHKSVADQ